MIAASHPLEADRLAALRAYGILDTAREKDFDDIVGLASAICGVPISVINLIDADRQWFKAEVGLGVRETPIDASICAHAILEESFVEIRDTLLDDRMRDNALCRGDRGLRFYAGAQLLTGDGLPIGTLCVLDYAPRTLDDLQREALRVLARQVMKQLELRRALAQAELLRHEVDHRVKNSLQSVAALTRLQSRAAATPEARSALGTVLQRIETVAALHEQIYRTKTDDEVEISVYLGRVARFMDSMRPPDVTLRIDLAPLTVGSRQAGALAVVMNEIVQNAFVHAFPGDRPGRIDVTGALSEDGEHYRLRLSDDGIGFPMDHRRDGGLGLVVIDASAEQLNADLGRLDVAEGTAFLLQLPVEMMKASAASA